MTRQEADEVAEQVGNKIRDAAMQIISDVDDDLRESILCLVNVGVEYEQDDQRLLALHGVKNCSDEAAHAIMSACIEQEDEETDDSDANYMEVLATMDVDALRVLAVELNLVKQKKSSKLKKDQVLSLFEEADDETLYKAMGLDE